MALTDIIGGSVADGVAKIISLFKVDPNLAAQNAEKLAEIQADIQKKALDAAIAEVQAQGATNAAEAASGKIFIAGWRPFIGWVCGSGLAFQFIIAPIATWITELFGKHTTMPSLDMGTLITLLLGMLGLGGMRTFEKVNGVNSGH